MTPGPETSTPCVHGGCSQSSVTSRYYRSTTERRRSPLRSVYTLVTKGPVLCTATVGHPALGTRARTHRYTHGVDIPWEVGLVVTKDPSSHTREHTGCGRGFNTQGLWTASVGGSSWNRTGSTWNALVFYPPWNPPLPSSSREGTDVGFGSRISDASLMEPVKERRSTGRTEDRG